jgi:NAD(P)-dependent dehydrogenase (short-subunit alcohol dehydrogenase family)
MGLAIARTFGSRGYNVALIARDPSKLDRLVSQLTTEGTNAAAFPADVLHRDGLTQALDEAAAHYGGIDVLEHSPSPSFGALNLTAPSQTTPTDVQALLELQLYSAITATQAVLPAMRHSGAGTLLYTNGGGSIDPNPMLGNVNAAQAALRNWVLNLHKELSEEGIQAAHLAINVWIGAGAPPGVPTAEAEEIAPMYWDLHVMREKAESVFSA